MVKRQKETGNSQLEAYQVQRLQAFIESNGKEKKAGIVFAGDSIVEFFPLKKYLGHDFPLINRGISGTDSVWLLQHLQEQVLAIEPSQIFLLIGTNDLGRGYVVRDIVNRLSRIIAQLRQELYGCQIYLLSVLPVNEDEAYAGKVKIRRNADIQALNQDLQALAGAEFINLYPLLLDDKGNLASHYSTDGLHLSQAGYGKIAELLSLIL